jgi:hypothetical protein
MVMMEMGNTLEEMDNKKILIVGNGFDLAHNLKTRYSDVLEVFKKRKSFYGLYINRKIDTGFDEKIADNIPKALESYDSKNLEKLDKIIRNNSWVEYYSGCGAELDLWIDFERELVPVLDIFDFILSADINFEDGSIEFERNSFFKFNCYFSRYFTILNNKIFVKNYYIDSSYVMGKMYALFVSEEVLEPSMDNEMILTGVGHNKGRRLDRTLGALIKSDFAKKEILSEYMKIIDIIFCKLNIRNCIMHGLGETFDYLNIGIVAIMFQLLWDVAACEIFID